MIFSYQMELISSDGKVMGHAFDFIRFIDLDFCLHSPLLLRCAY